MAVTTMILSFAVLAGIFYTVGMVKGNTMLKKLGFVTFLLPVATVLVIWFTLGYM